MITAKDVREEIKTARTVIEDAKATEADKLKVIFKLIEVGIKIGLGNRVNLVKVMENLGVEKVKPRTQKDNAEKKETSKE